MQKGFRVLGRERERGRVLGVRVSGFRLLGRERERERERVSGVRVSGFGVLGFRSRTGSVVRIHVCSCRTIWVDPKRARISRSTQMTGTEYFKGTLMGT